MDKAGYKAYLQELGNQQHYIGRIPELLELEKKLNIDLDDYIPYNEDFSKVAALDALLPEEIQHNEKIQLAINSYMRYRLSGYCKIAKDEGKESVECTDCFSFHGTEQELKEKLLSFMSEEDSLSFIKGLQEYHPYLGEDEFITVESSIPFGDPESDPRMLHYLVQSINYNINIKALTLTALALLLDIKLTLGFASTTLALLGVNSQAIARIDATEGEKCLIIEAMHSPNRIISKDVFSHCNHQCVHNDLECNYQKDDNCTITTDKITAILDGLCDKNIFKKIKGLYKYNF